MAESHMILFLEVVECALIIIVNYIKISMMWFEGLKDSIATKTSIFGIKKRSTLS